MNLPHIDLDELREMKKQNFKARLAFIEQYAAWIKKQTNKTWSSQHAKMLKR
jgi:hypothetical protein